jgi:threonine-phosphate decarboxylase
MIDSLPVHGGQILQLSERFGIPTSQLLDFSANINPEGPPTNVLSVLRKSLDDLSVLTNYPDLEQVELKRALARYAGVLPQNIAVANGFVPLLEATLRTLPIRRCHLLVPSFVEYRKALRRARIEAIPYVLTCESDFKYDVEAIVTGQEDAVLMANPQNPSGVGYSRETLLQLVASAAKRNVYVLLDEAFIDYLPDDSLTGDIDRFPNLVVFRSVTKFWGIPGLRVAYMAAHPDIIRVLDECLPPWLITTLAARAVIAALEDEPYVNLARRLNRQRRARLQAEIEALGIHTYPSAANFLLLRLPSLIDPIAFWERMIVEHYIVLRLCANYEALPDGHLRSAVRNNQENARLILAISRILAEFRGSPQKGKTILCSQLGLSRMASTSPSVTKSRTEI